MSAFNEVDKLLKTKLELFLKYESISRDMLECKPDMFAPLFAKRDRLAQQIDETDAAIKSVCAADKDGEKLLGAAYNKCDFSDLDSEDVPLFKQGQDIFAVMSRISSFNPQIELRLVQLKDEAEKALKELNDGNAAKASRFNSGIESPGWHHGTLGNA